MKFVFCAFVVLSFSEAFAAPQTALEGENSGGVSVLNTISSRDELFSEDSILQSDTAQGRKIKFLNKGAAYLKSSEESGESASIEDSEESSDKKVTKTKPSSESSSTEDSDESAPLENNQENETNFKSIKGETSGGRPVVIIVGRPKGEPEAGEAGKTAETADTTHTVYTADTADTVEAAATPKPGSPTNPTTAHSVTPKPTTAGPQTKKPESKPTTASLYTKEADPKPITVKPLATEAASAKPVDEATNGPVEIAITPKPKPKPPKKPKPAKATTASPLAAEAATATPASPATVAAAPPSPPSTEAPTRRYPCRCAGGLCSCCTGMLLENLNVPIRSRACANITYEPDDFAFNFALSYNSRVLYNTRVSAKNPRPVCIPINRYFGVKMCAKISNVYMSGRNVHACLDLEGFLDDETAFQYSFNCFRIGASGVAVVRPEDGGGLPPPPDEEPQTNEDYDDSARGWTGEVQLAAV